MAIGRTNCGVGGSTGGLPQFTYTGDFSVLDEGNKNWRINFLTSGTLTFTKAPGTIDAFLVGGGGGGGDHVGGGGGGGYTLTQNSIPLVKGMAYEIVIGAGGSGQTASGYQDGGDGGETRAFDRIVHGGYGGKSGDNASRGGNGASGGGTGVGSGSAYGGGSNGSNGSGSKAGSGQGTTTYEFGDATATLYSGGGGGGGVDGGGSGGDGGGAAGGKDNTTGSSASSNTGGGGGGGGRYANGGNGGSGIVVIRNHREAA